MLTLNINAVSSAENICRIPPTLAEFATQRESQEAATLKERSLKVSSGYGKMLQGD